MIKQNATPQDLAKQVLKKVKGAKISQSIPSETVLTKIFNTLFYTSLQTEEGQHIKVTVTLIDSDNPDPNPPARIVADRWQYVKFEKQIPFNTKNLVKLSKAADVWSSSLAIYYNDDDIYIWGMIDQAIHYHSYLNFESDTGPEQPGIFQSTITGIGNLMVIFDYELIATLKHDSLITNYINVFKKGEFKDLLEKTTINLNEKITTYLSDEFPHEDVSFWQNISNNHVKEAISRILLRIQNYQHGGAILITNDIELDIKYPIKYERLSNSITKVSKFEIANSSYTHNIFDSYLEKNKEKLPVSLYLNESISNFEMDDAKDELKGAIRFVSSLSCVDGLVLLNNDLTIRGFGVVIRMSEIPEFVYISKTAKINSVKLVKINSNSYGTRHRSMFSYCWNHNGSIGFVISQDGDIRAVSRFGDKLVIWENIKVQRHSISHKLKKPSLKLI